MDEFSLIQKYFSRGHISNDVIVGIGDDCAIVEPPVGRQLVMSIDTQVAGVHFPMDAEPGQIGARALCTALSDLAAMGATAHWFTLALTLPDADPDWLSGFSDGMMAVANQHGCCLIGGDTTRGPLCISIQVHGSVPSGGALQRSSAAPEDIIFVTGHLGDGAAALAVIEKKLTVGPAAFEYLINRFYNPIPRLREGVLLLGTATAAIDISDGVLADVRKICEASGVGAVVDVNRLPVSERWRDGVNEDKRREWALAGGDDYELCFTVPRASLHVVDTWIRKHKIVATPIGKMTNRQGVVLMKDGKNYELQKEGFDHFGQS